MHLKILFTGLLSSLILLTSCIKNDIPYPYVVPTIDTIRFEGEESLAKIDASRQLIQVNFPEEIDLSKVKIQQIQYTEGASLEIHNGQIINLRKPYNFKTEIYKRQFQWTIEAKQQIARIFRVQKQIGKATFDPIGLRAIVYVGKKTPLTSIIIDSLKLGEKGSQILSPDTQHLLHRPLDMRLPLSVKIKSREGIKTWSLFVYQTNKTVETLPADAWCRLAYLHGIGTAGETVGFEYKAEDQSEWTKVKESEITHKDGTFSATIKGLQPGKTYTYHAIVGKEKGGNFSFTTALPIPLPQANFDDWSLDGKVWNPWLVNSTHYWDTGNKGAATIGDSNVIPISDDLPADAKGKYAVKLSSKWSLIKLAAGSLFLGKYLRTDGTNGVLSFGIPYTSYPTKVQGYYKYHPGIINRIGDNSMQNLKGKPDSCHIYAILTDLEQPLEIRTNPSNRQLVDFNAKYVIAKAELTVGREVNEWTKFEINFDYKATNRQPKQLIFVISSSKFGDFFTGSDSSVLYVDDFSFGFD